MSVPANTSSSSCESTTKMHTAQSQRSKESVVRYLYDACSSTSRLRQQHQHLRGEEQHDLPASRWELRRRASSLPASLPPCPCPYPCPCLCPCLSCSSSTCPWRTSSRHGLEQSEPSRRHCRDDCRSVPPPLLPQLEQRQRWTASRQEPWWVQGTAS